MLLFFSTSVFKSGSLPSPAVNIGKIGERIHFGRLMSCTARALHSAMHLTPSLRLLHVLVCSPLAPLTAVAALSLIISARSFGTPLTFTLPDSWLDDTLRTCVKQRLHERLTERPGVP